MMNMNNTPALSRFPTDSSADDELDRALRTPPDYRVVSRGQLVPAHSPNEKFIGTPFSTSNMFEYPFHPEEQSPRDSKPIAIKTAGDSAQHAGNSSNGSSPSSPHYVRALREVSKEAPVPPSLREKVMALGA